MKYLGPFGKFPQAESVKFLNILGEIYNINKQIIIDYNTKFTKSAFQHLQIDSRYIQMYQLHYL